MMYLKGRRISVRNAWLGASTAVIATMLAMPAGAQDSAPLPSATTADEAQSTSEDGDPSIVVTGRRKSLADAIARKKDSDTIVDSVVKDEADRLPDSSITEILQRVPGVTLSRFTAANGGTPSFQIEGTGISVRGLPYNSSMLNGRQVFSANGASAISWGEVTPELMAGVDVYKASRADLIEGGASMVDLRTKVPFDFQERVNDISIGASYGDLARKVSPNVSALYSERFDSGIGEFGILWDLAYNRYYSQSSSLQLSPYFAQYFPDAPNQMALVPSGYGWGNNEFTRDRYGAYQALQWKPSSTLTLTNTVFYSKYVTDSMGTSAGFGTSPSAAQTYIPTDATFDANGAMVSGSLRLGSTGQVVFGPGGNTWLQEHAPASWGFWSPAPTTDCGGGGGYGAPVSQATANWGTFQFGCTEPLTNVQGFSGSSSAGHSENSTLDISQSLVWNPMDRMRVRAGAQYVSSRAKGKNMYAGITQTDPNLSSASFDVTGSIPVLGGFDQEAATNTSTAYWNSMSYNGADNKGTMLAGNIDIDYEFGDEHFLRAISVGGRMSERKERDNFIGTYWTSLAEPWAGIQYFLNDTQNPENSSPPSDYMVATFPQFFGGSTPVPSNVLVPSTSLMNSFDWCYLKQNYNGNPPALPDTTGPGPDTCENYWRAIDNGLGVTNTKINNVAGYLQVRFGHDRIGIIPPFSGNIGVRIFRDRLAADGNFQQGGCTTLSLLTPSGCVTPRVFYLNEADAAAAAAADLNDTERDPATGWSPISLVEPRFLNYSYTRVLPSANIRFDFSPKFIVRLAASMSSSPPNLGDIRAGGSVNPNTRSVSYAGPPPSGGGQPSTANVDILTNMVNQSSGAERKPVKITSEDISFEFYPRSQTYFWINLFAKQIRDQDVFRAFVQVQPTPLVNGLGETQIFDVPWTYLQNQTSEEPAKIKGFEVGGRMFFDKLPGLLGGFGIGANLTFVDSSNPNPQAQNVLNPNAPSATNPSADFGKLPYYGLSRITYNIELMYNRGPVNLRLAYNWHSKQLLSTNANPYSFAATGGNPYRVNLSPTDFSSQYSFNAWPMVPLWSAAAGYLDFGADYKFNDRMSVSLQANNLLNTLSKTYQEPIDGVFLPANTYVSDRRVSVSARMRF